MIIKFLHLQFLALAIMKNLILLLLVFVVLIGCDPAKKGGNTNPDPMPSDSLIVQDRYLVIFNRNYLEPTIDKFGLKSGEKGEKFLAEVENYT